MCARGSVVHRRCLLFSAPVLFLRASRPCLGSFVRMSALAVEPRLFPSSSDASQTCSCSPWHTRYLPNRRLHGWAFDCPFASVAVAPLLFSLPGLGTCICFCRKLISSCVFHVPPRLGWIRLDRPRAPIASHSFPCVSHSFLHPFFTARCAKWPHSYDMRC